MNVLLRNMRIVLNKKWQKYTYTKIQYKMAIVYVSIFRTVHMKTKYFLSMNMIENALQNTRFNTLVRMLHLMINQVSHAIHNKAPNSTYSVS